MKPWFYRLHRDFPLAFALDFLDLTTFLRQIFWKIYSSDFLTTFYDNNEYLIWCRLFWCHSQTMVSEIRFICPEYFFRYIPALVKVYRILCIHLFGWDDSKISTELQLILDHRQEVFCGIGNCLNSGFFIIGKYMYNLFILPMKLAIFLLPYYFW